MILSSLMPIKNQHHSVFIVYNNQKKKNMRNGYLLAISTFLYLRGAFTLKSRIEVEMGKISVIGYYMIIKII